MENLYAAAIKDLQAETVILRTALSTLLQVLAVEETLSKDSLQVIINGIGKAIEMASFRDEARKQGERDLHEILKADINRIHDRLAEARASTDL